MTMLVNGEWRRLADYVRSARVARGFASQMALAQAAGVSEGSVRALESGKVYSRMPVVVPAIEQVLGWAPGTMRRLVEGEEPGPIFSGEGTLGVPAGPALTPEQKDKFRELVLRSRVMSPAVREQVLAEIEATPIVTTDG
jgi:hypothetical protein